MKTKQGLLLLKLFLPSALQIYIELFLMKLEKHKKNPYKTHKIHFTTNNKQLLIFNKFNSIISVIPKDVYFCKIISGILN